MNSKRSSEFYEDPKNFGHYAYHGNSNSWKRAADELEFYEDPKNFGHYAYHGNSNSWKRAADELEFYEDPKNFGHYAYHGNSNSWKRSTELNRRNSEFLHNPNNYGYFNSHVPGVFHNPELRSSSETIPESTEIQVTPLNSFRSKRYMKRSIPRLSHKGNLSLFILPYEYV